MSHDARAFLDETIKTCFYKGAPTDLQQMLKGFEVANPGNSDLQTLHSTAERFDNIYNFKPDSVINPRPTTSLQSTQKIATAPTFNQHDPYATEVDHLVLPRSSSTPSFKRIIDKTATSGTNTRQPIISGALAPT
ncbi:hypothetical protein BGZ68_004352, partial [Mortierella alpina]